MLPELKYEYSQKKNVISIYALDTEWALSVNEKRYVFMNCISNVRLIKSTITDLYLVMVNDTLIFTIESEQLTIKKD